MKKKKPKSVGKKIFSSSISELANGTTKPSVVLKLREAGLPVPGPALGSKAFKDLQKEWYTKLEADGFKDLEWVDHKTGLGHDGPHLRGSLQGGALFHPGRALYYSLASNYLVHCKSLRGYDKYIWTLHADGVTYDQIVLDVAAKYGPDSPSKYKLYYQLQALAKRCRRWNLKYPEGLLYKRAEDKLRILESHLADFIETEYDWIEGESPL